VLVDHFALLEHPRVNAGTFSPHKSLMHLLFPSDPINRSVVDETYREEREASRAHGITSSLFSFEDFEAGEFKPRPALTANEEVLYRGWMLTPDGYSRLDSAVTARGGALKTSPAQYRRCHYLPEWYALCADVTPETIVVPRDTDFVTVLAGKNWPAYFVKDYVKSLTTQRGSVAATPQDVAEIVSLIEQYRGTIEGGICIRKFEILLPESEERYFVLNGQAHAREGDAPPLVHELARRIDSPFFSVDVIASHTGELRLVELGDGQVSDRKKWPVERFVSLLRDSWLS
jgi:hypothetical protein